MNSYEFQKEHTRNKGWFLFVVLIIAALIVGLICILFVGHIKQVTYKESERYLSELTDSLSRSVDIQINENLKELKSISMTYTAIKNNGTYSEQYLQEKADLLDFVRVSVVNEDGTSFSSDGFEFDFSDYKEIMSVFNGEAIVCNGIEEYTGTKNSFIYAVPVYERGNVTSVMVTCSTSEWLENFINQRFFDGGAYFHIFEKDGTFVTYAQNNNTVLEGDNIFSSLEKVTVESQKSIEEMHDDVNEGKSGYMYFSGDDDNRRIMFYRALKDFDNFYISMMVSRKSATSFFDRLVWSAVAVNLFIALLYAALVVAMFITYRRNNLDLTEIAFVDPITGGRNHVCFELEAEQLLKKAKPKEFSFITINISKFKLINDSFGNDAGNNVLKYIYRTIDKHLKQGELLCRMASDNFDILVHNRTEKGILEFMKGIAEDINIFNTNESYKYYISITGGVYCIAEPELSIISIRDRANVARKNLRAASGNHLFSCVFYSDVERLRQLREKEIENKMESALKNDDFVVYLQPKVTTSNKVISGAEALVRWLDKEKGLIPPNDFIPFFEKNGFIIKLDLYVFEQVCKYIRKWIDNGKAPVPVSVNLSKRHLENPDFIESYREIQKKYNIPPELIEIELTETLVFENLEQIIQTVTKIHDSGFSCSLDDFGSGYSSLNMLKDIKVDALKLDREFFSSPNSDNPRERAIIQSVVDMAKKLNMTTISEGVETLYQLEFLKKIDCDMAQGFVISKPVPIDEFEMLAFGAAITE